MPEVRQAKMNGQGRLRDAAALGDDMGAKSLNAAEAAPLTRDLTFDQYVSAEQESTDKPTASVVG